MQYEYYDRVRVPKYLLRSTKDVARLAELVNRSLPLFHALLKFDEHLIVTLKALRGTSSGMYDPNVNEVEVDFRGKDDFTLLSIVAHELVHAEQYYQGRLDSEWYGSGYSYRWYDTYYCIFEKDYNKYIPPWEIEAYERQDGLALVVCTELGV